MKIQVLMENTTHRENMLTEHGLSLYIETEHHKILFDMGQSGNFAVNARTMGVDLTQVDLAVISHGHYDHGGGLEKFLEINHTAPVYVNQRAVEEYWHGEKYIGLDRSLAHSDRLIFVDDQLVIDDELALYTGNSWPAAEPINSAGLSVRKNGELVPDDFRHEMYLRVQETDETVLFSGCSHKGVRNLHQWFRPDRLIGGYHFSKMDPEHEGGREALKETAEYLMQFPTLYWTCHCTGVRQYEFLREFMGKRLNYLSTGDTLTL